MASEIEDDDCAWLEANAAKCEEAGFAFDPTIKRITADDYRAGQVDEIRLEILPMPQSIPAAPVSTGDDWADHAAADVLPPPQRPLPSAIWIEPKAITTPPPERPEPDRARTCLTPAMKNMAYRQTRPETLSPGSPGIAAMTCRTRLRSRLRPIRNGRDTMMTMERLTALDFQPARRARKTARAIRLEASTLQSESNYLAILCGPSDSEWLQTAERMAEVALRLETAANRFSRTAKGFGAYAGFTAQISEPSRTWAESAKVIGMDSEDPVLTGFKLKTERNGPEAA